MKKLLYIALAEFENPADGVGIKIHSQIKGMKQLNYDVYCVSYGLNGVCVFHDQEKKVLAEGKIPDRLMYMRALLQYIKENSFEVCYIRYPHIDWYLKQAIKKLKRAGSKIFIEIPTYPVHVPNLRQDGIVQIVIYGLDKFFTRDLKRYVRRVLYIGNPTENIWECSSLHIANGCDVEQYLMKEKKQHDPDRLTMIAVAGMFTHHGFERLLQGMADYYRKGERPVSIKLYMVGEGPEKAFYQQLCEVGDLGDHVIFCGAISGSELDVLFDEADIAVTSLGLYKEKLYCASTLKLKEYLSRGIPFILACEEEGLDSSLPYVLKVDNNESVLDMERVIGFYQSVGQQDFREQMRRYAASNYSWRAIYQKALNEP